MIKSSVHPIQLSRIKGGIKKTAPDLVAVEEPLEIRLGYGPTNERSQKSLAVTMRTPGHDLELAIGFLYTEGIIRAKEDLLSIKHCTDKKTGETQENIVRVELAPTLRFDPSLLERHFYTHSSCGVCGKASIESIESTCIVAPTSQVSFESAMLHELPDKLRESQQVFEHTGGIHACGLFDTKGNLLLMREDVGRHNALDKLIGAALYEYGFPLEEHLLLFSGRCSFELVQKALHTGVALVASVGAPSSLAVALAQNYQLSLVGFLKKHSLNVYVGESRIKTTDPDGGLTENH